MNWDIWGPPLVVVATGLVAGLFVAFRSAGAGEAAAPAPVAGTRVEDLRARKEALVEELRGLDAERNKLPPGEFEERWTRTLDRAAAALRELDLALAEGAAAADAAAAAGAAPAATSPSPVASPRGSMRPVLWSLGAVGFFVLLGLTLARTSKPRADGGSMTGMSVGGGDAPAMASASPQVQAAQAAFQANPDDLDAAAYLAHASIRSGDLQAGMQYVEAGRRVAPDDARIQASLAALMIAIGYLDRAEQTLDTVTTSSPDLAAGWLWMGVLRMSQGDTPGAEQALSRAMQLTADPEDKRLAAGLLTQLHQGGAAAMSAAPAAPAAAASTPPAATSRVSGRVEAAPGVTVPEGAIVFVYARNAEAGRGPPLAALRLPARLPLDFSLSEADVIMAGMPWPDQVWVSAKVDLDGNAGTKEDGAPASAVVGPIGAGAGPVTLTLQ